MGVNSEELSDVAVLHVENRIRHIQEQQLYQKKQRTFQLQQAAAQAAAVQAEFQHTQTVQELEWTLWAKPKSFSKSSRPKMANMWISGPFSST
jgi:hypothetical protein